MYEHARLPVSPQRFNIAGYCLAAQARHGRSQDGTDHRGRGVGSGGYRELDLMVRRLAGGLGALGLPPGERLMIRMDNDLEYILTFFAALAAGLVPLPSSAALTSEEAEFLLADPKLRCLPFRMIFHSRMPSRPRCGSCARSTSPSSPDPAIRLTTPTPPPRITVS